GGPVGLLLEYVRSSHDVRHGAAHGAIVFQAWQVQLSVLLTPGDKASYDNVLPKKPLEYKNLGYGAVGFGARYHEITVGLDGDATFPTYIDPTKSAHGARAFGVGLNWWANSFFRASINFEHANFIGGAKVGDRTPEDALLGRLQAMW